LCLTCDSNQRNGKLVLFSDKLQTISSFGHLPPINIETLRQLVQIEHFLYLVHSHQITRIDLTNEHNITSQLFKERIKKAAVHDDNILLWIEDEHNNHSVLFLSP
jgi:hypothetical protein